MKTDEIPKVAWAQRFAHRTLQMRRSAVRELLKLTAEPEMISLAGGLPAAELFPVEEVKQATERVLGRKGRPALQYGQTEGLAELREWVANYLSGSGLALSRSNVLITSGAQQAIDLVGRVLLDRGDRVLVENPTYLATLSAWRPLGVQFAGVQTDEEGPCPAAIESLLGLGPKLLYCIPNFQNPQGVTATPARRERLVELLWQKNVAIVEDNPYGELRYDGQGAPHLLELDGRIRGGAGLNGNVIHIGTFSKVLAPGFRVGWVVAPEPVIEQLVQAKQAADLHTSTFNQHIIYELVSGGFLSRHLPLLRAAYKERRDAMLGALNRHFPVEVAWTKPAGGMFLMLTLPAALDAAGLLKRAIQRKVAFVPGEDFHLDGQGANTLRLNFTNAGPALLEEGVRRLAEAYYACVEDGSSYVWSRRI